MNLQNLFAVVVCASAVVTQGQETVSVSPDADDVAFTIFESTDDTTAASLFRDAEVRDHEMSRLSFEPTGDAALVQLSHYRELEDRVASLQSEIQQLQYSTSARATSAYGAQPAGADCGCSGLCRCETHPVFFGAAEVPFLRARISGASPVFNVSPEARRLIDPNYDPSVRYVAELRPENSLGLRGRYFRYDHTSAFDPPFQPAELGIELETADLEVVFHHEFHRWNLDLSAGVEYARMQYSADVATAVIGAGNARFEGIGPVFALNAEHKLGTSQLSFFGSVRASFLMGTLKNQALLINMPQSEIKDEMAQVYQNQLGIVWNPELFDRFGIAVRAGWETQFWLNETFSDDSYGIGSNLSVTGPMVSAELTY